LTDSLPQQHIQGLSVVMDISTVIDHLICRSAAKNYENIVIAPQNTNNNFHHFPTSSSTASAKH